MVGTPGVEGRRAGCGFAGLRDDSRGDGPDSAGLAAGGGNASEVSGGLVEVRCSGVVGGPLGGGESNEIEGLQARLAALEAALPLVEGLIAGGDVRGALAVVRALRHVPQCS